MYLHYFMSCLYRQNLQLDNNKVSVMQAYIIWFFIRHSLSHSTEFWKRLRTLWNEDDTMNELRSELATTAAKLQAAGTITPDEANECMFYRICDTL